MCMYFIYMFQLLGRVFLRISILADSPSKYKMHTWIPSLSPKQFKLVNYISHEHNL